MMPSLSIIIPAYNEASCIEDSVSAIMRFARAYSGRSQVIVVDDGSTDSTPAIVSALLEKRSAGDPELSLICHECNRGKGAGVRTGFTQASGEIVLFTDADLSAPVSEAPLLIEPIAQGRYDIVIGSRALDPSLIETHQSGIRRASGRVFNWMVRRIAGLKVQDTQCGFKAFRRAAAAPAFAMQRIDGFAFDVELLYLATRMGLRILEVPVRWSHVHDSKVSLIHHSPQMFVELFGIRYRDWFGHYPWPAAPGGPDASPPSVPPHDEPGPASHRTADPAISASGAPPDVPP